MLQSLADLAYQPRIIELGCGAAALSRKLLERFPAGAQAIPFAAKSFDLALMLKSLHHVPLDLLNAALNEVMRVNLLRKRA